MQCEPYFAVPLYNGGILRNPSFDNGTNNWTGYRSASVTLRIESQVNGNKYQESQDNEIAQEEKSWKISLTNLLQTYKSVENK